MMEILTLARAGFGGLDGLLTLDSPAILDALEWMELGMMMPQEAGHGRQ